jgi:hypothetical protein
MFGKIGETGLMDEDDATTGLPQLMITPTDVLQK